MNHDAHDDCGHGVASEQDADVVGGAAAQMDDYDVQPSVPDDAQTKMAEDAPPAPAAGEQSAPAGP